MGLDKQNIDDAKKELNGLIEDLHENKISNEELAESKTHLIGMYRMAHQSNQSQAWYLGWWEIVGKGYAYDERYVYEIQQVTAEDVHRVAVKYLNPKRATRTVQGTP